jgi:hypothetical protein
VETKADVAVTIPKTVVEQMTDAPSLTIETGVADVTFDEKALSKIVETAAEITLQTKSVAVDDLTEAQQKAVSDDAVIIDLNLTDTEGTKVTFSDDNTGTTGTATVTVPFEIPEGEDAANYVVYYIDNFGNKTKVDSTFEDVYVTFTATHFSTYSAEKGLTLEMSDFDDSTGSNTPAIIKLTGSRTFTVTCDLACTVAYTLDGGTTYTKLTATAVEGSDNCYSFEVPSKVTSTEIKIAVVLTGDLNMDGSVDGIDALLIQRYVIQLKTLNELQLLVSDVNRDDSVDGIDALLIRRLVIHVRGNFNW